MNRVYIHRQIENEILEASTQFPIITLTGPRQTGKSTLLKHCFPDYRYVTLDDPVLRRSCIEDPALFIENYPAPCIIDEIQYAPELLPYLKIIVDQNRNDTGLYIITGSQFFPLMCGLSESLAGRTAVFELYGFNLEEFNSNEKNITEIFQRIFTGSFPDPLIHGTKRTTFYSSYVQTYLERDIRQIENIHDISLFINFLELLAARSGSILNKNELSNQLGVSQTTVKRWLTLLENSRIIYLLRPFSKNINKRVIKSPKLYFTDTGLLNYLLKYPDSTTLLSGPQNGHILETFVVTEILKTINNLNMQINLYYYRDSNRNEIDLIMDTGFKQFLCEIKMAKKIQPGHYNQLNRLKDLFTDPQLFILSGYENEIKLTRDISNIPVWECSKLLQGVG